MSDPAKTLAGYQALREGAGYHRFGQPGCLRVGGEHRLDFLQRQTTNNMTLLTEGRALLNVLTSPAARILEVFIAVHEPEAIGLVTGPGRAEPLASYLRSRIFFMDRVTVEDASPTIALFSLDGPAAPQVLRALGAAQAPERDQVVPLEGFGAGGRVIGVDGLTGPGFLLLIPIDAAAHVAERLAEAGAEPVGEEAREVARIERGLPGQGAEISEEYTPLEVGLSRAVADNKGCYTGQEVIARQISRDRVTRHLAGLRLAAPAPPGAPVLVDGRRVGEVTSAAISPRFGPIALAVLRRPHDKPGTVLAAAAGDVEIAAQAVALPFG
ncbi:MAG: glycine cleavage T C-terminal barrel domain-containing protein [Anaerolineae bacterium]